jgi:subtilase family serine protease
MRMTMVLPLRNQDQLKALLSDLYNPSSPNYRHFLSVDQFAAQFGPTPEDYQAVVQYARTNGFQVTDTPVNRLIVPIVGTVAQVEAAFHVTMNQYKHPTEKRNFYSPDREPTLAAGVPVAHIAGLNNYSLPRPAVARGTPANGVAPRQRVRVPGAPTWAATCGRHTTEARP